jgi:hypothetical protein
MIKLGSIEALWCGLAAHVDAYLGDKGSWN